MLAHDGLVAVPDIIPSNGPEEIIVVEHNLRFTAVSHHFDQNSLEPPADPVVESIGPVGTFFIYVPLLALEEQRGMQFETFRLQEMSFKLFRFAPGSFSSGSQLALKTGYYD